MDKKQLKKIRKMKPNENMHITLENGKKAEGKIAVIPGSKESFDFIAILIPL